MPRDYEQEEEEEEDDELFFDSREVLPTPLDSCHEENSVSLIDRDPLNYLVWVRSPGSVLQRRTVFMRMIGIDHVVRRPPPDSVHENGSLVMVNGSSTSDFIKFEHEIENLDDDDDDKVFVADEFDHVGAVRSIQEAGGSNQIALMDESERTFETCSSNQQLGVRHRRRMVGWLRRLGAVACISGKQDREFGSGVSDSVHENGSLVMVNGSSTADFIKLSEDASSAIQFEHEIENLDDDDKVFVAGEFKHEHVGAVRSIQEAGSSNQIALMDESERSFETCSSNQQLRVRHRRRMVGCLRRLGAVACISGKQDREFGSGVSDSDQSRSTGLRVRVCSYRKESKELSAVYMGQNFVAHHGAVLAMKFSSDGEYLASGGEDGVVRVWKVMECPWSNAADIPVDDPSCIYFCLNQKSELLHLYVDKEQSTDTKSLRRTADPACVVIPQELFRLSEKPLREFHGHSGEILDLAWSKDNALLSSSTDKTVRLWKLGCESFIKVFPHINYVTCIQFNPIDERYFISGSIDGKTRIWAIAACRVVDWIDVRHIVTAVCYRPDGKALVVGSIMGDCRFYDLSDNNLQLEAVVSFQGRKRSVDKRITGFQFCPGDPLKLMVTSADSTVRILDGINLISKYKGLRNSGSRISAIFTSDGRHIVSASEDSNVYIWNHSNKDHIPSPNNVKNTWSSEHFPSSHASIAMPWPGFSSKNLHVGSAGGGRSAAHFSPSKSFTLWPEFFSEIAPKGSATWPEEKLPSSTDNSSGLVKSQLRVLKTSWRTNTAHAWGQVIVTAGRDGKIRSFQNYGMPVSL